MKHDCQLKHTFASRDVHEAASRPDGERVLLHGKTQCAICGEEGTVRIEMPAHVAREMKRRADEADIGYA